MLTEKPTKTVDSRKELARTFLELANTTFQQSRAHRGYYARLAHEYGMTYSEIGQAYGVSEAAARGLAKRAN